MAKVLVLGHGSRAFLSVIRSLGRGGLEVHAAWHSSACVALRSRYLSQTHEIPGYSEIDRSWVDALGELMRRERFDLVMPCTDSSVTALQRHRRKLEPAGRIYLISDTAFEVLFDKVKTNELAREMGVSLPREVIVTEQGEGAKLPQEFGLPIVLKPPTSHNPDDPDAKRMVRKAYSRDEFDRLLGQMLRTGPVAVQENILGRGVGVELLLADGAPLLQFQHERVHEPLQGGGSSYRKAVAVDPELLEASLALLRPLKYSGVAMVEFKVDPASGRWALMEVNARFWGSLPLAIAAGVDFPLALYQFLVEDRRDFRQGYRTGVHCRNLLMDAAWQWHNLRADHSDPTLATRPLRRVVRDAVLNLLTWREHADTVALDDPVPALAELREMVRLAIPRLRRLWTWRWQRLGSVRRRAARRAAEALSQADSVLFVCKGNICRSPFAAELARKRELFPAVASSGYYRVSGRRSPEEAVAAAGTFEVNLRDHRSRRLDTAQLEGVDAVIVFDLENYTQVRSQFPATRDRLHFAGNLDPSGRLEIADPWGKSPADFARIYEEIDAVLRRIGDLRSGEGSPH